VQIGGSECFEFFTWLGSGRRLLFSPLIFGERGVAAACSFYKSSRGGSDFIPHALAQKSSCLLFSLPPSSPLHPASTLLCSQPWPATMRGPPSNVTRSALDARVKGGLLCPITDVGSPEWIAPPVSDREPNPPPGYVVCFLSFLDRGFGTPAAGSSGRFSTTTGWSCTTSTPTR